ncbi:MAG TPA: serine/threonine-protein kinase, partial [Polyangiaceae bacterium]
MSATPSNRTPTVFTGAPARIGSYQLLVPIASGGMATVYLARQVGPGGFEREVALKLTHAFLREQPEWVMELVEEAKLASRIHHPNVVQVLDVQDGPSGVFLVMQYVEGDTLYGLSRRAAAASRRIPTDIALRILLDALAGLHAAHELRDAEGRPLEIVHRDFTPQNILVGVDGVSRLADFGVAKSVARIGATRTGVIKGKAAYMSPEQVRAMPVDQRADVWAAGVVAWELFAGRRLHHRTETSIELLLKVATQMPPRLRTACPDIPAAVDEAVAFALTLDLARRCPSAAELAERLTRGWADAAGAAEPADVAAYVRAAVGEELTTRRQRVAGIVGERCVSESDATLVTITKPREDGPRRPRTRVLLLAVGLTAIFGTLAIAGVVRHEASSAAPSDPAARTTVSSAGPTTTTAAPSAFPDAERVAPSAVPAPARPLPLPTALPAWRVSPPGTHPPRPS